MLGFKFNFSIRQQLQKYLQFCKMSTSGVNNPTKFFKDFCSNYVGLISSLSVPDASFVKYCHSLTRKTQKSLSFHEHSIMQNVISIILEYFIQKLLKILQMILDRLLQHRVIFFLIIIKK